MNKYTVKKNTEALTMSPGDSDGITSSPEDNPGFKKGNGTDKKTSAGTENTETPATGTLAPRKMPERKD